jgi:hypothetical protein
VLHTCGVPGLPSTQGVQVVGSRPVQSPQVPFPSPPLPEAPLPEPGPVGEPLLVSFGSSSVAEQAVKQTMPTAVMAASKDAVRMKVPPRTPRARAVAPARRPARGF